MRKLLLVLVAAWFLGAFTVLRTTSVAAATVTPVPTHTPITGRWESGPILTTDVDFDGGRCDPARRGVIRVNFGTGVAPRLDRILICLSTTNLANPAWRVMVSSTAMVAP